MSDESDQEIRRYKKSVLVMQKEDVTTDLEDTKYSKMLIHIGCS